MIASPYGSWTSPITSDLVVVAAIRFDQIALDARTIYWIESQPQKQGRSFIYRADEGGEAELVTRDPAPAGEKAPVLVKSHGGPTASASSTRT